MSYLHKIEALKLKLTDEDLEKMGLVRLSKTKVATLEEFSKMKNLKVPGNLNLDETKIAQLPEGLRIRGHLWLRETKIKELPKGLQVGGWLDIRETKIKELPDDLKVSGFIFVNDPAKIKCSPELRKKLHQTF